MAPSFSFIVAGGQVQQTEIYEVRDYTFVNWWNMETFEPRKVRPRMTFTDHENNFMSLQTKSKLGCLRENIN